MLNQPKISLLRSSNKQFERRIPIHPEHLDLVPLEMRKYIHVEKSYAQEYNCDSTFFKKLGYSSDDSRDRLLASSNCTLIVRPTSHDLQIMKRNSISLGWFHCVQNQEMTDIALKSQLTLICMESLYDQSGNYLFQDNSKITGRQAVIHALEAAKTKFASDSLIIVIGHGSAGKAAIEKLQELGFNNIICCSKRSPSMIRDKIDGVKYEQIKNHIHNQSVLLANGSCIKYLFKSANMIINACKQDIRAPTLFLSNSDLKDLKDGSLIIDISCDKKMGFEFSQITSLKNPILKLDKILYYAVDHLPTLDYDNASKGISEKIITILPELISYLTLSKPNHPTIEKAIEIDRGKIINPDIFYFKENFI